MHVKIWSRDNCPFCASAQLVCERLDKSTDFSYEVVKLEVDYEVESGAESGSEQLEPHHHWDTPLGVS